MRPPAASRWAASRRNSVQAVELAVDPDADGLERPRCGIDSRVAAARHRAARDVGQPPGGLDRRRGTRGHDGPCDAAGVPFLAELVDHVGQRLLVGVGQHLGGRRPGGRVHAHVQDLVALKAEPPARRVELHRRHPQVHQHALDRSSPAARRAPRPSADSRRAPPRCADQTPPAPRLPGCTASGSRSNPMTRVAPASSTARACPPRPTVQSTNVPPRDGISRRQHFRHHHGLVGRLHSRAARRRQNAVFRQLQPVAVAPRLAQQLGVEPFRVPDFQVIDAPNHRDVAYNGGVFAQQRRNHHAALPVQLAFLPVEVHAVQELEPRRVVAGHLQHLLLDVQPHLHRVDRARTHPSGWSRTRRRSLARARVDRNWVGIFSRPLSSIRAEELPRSPFLSISGHKSPGRILGGEDSLVNRKPLICCNLGAVHSFNLRFYVDGPNLHLWPS